MLFSGTSKIREQLKTNLEEVKRQNGGEKEKELCENLIPCKDLQSLWRGAGLLKCAFSLKYMKSVSLLPLLKSPQCYVTTITWKNILPTRARFFIIEGSGPNSLAVFGLIQTT